MRSDRVPGRYRGLPSLLWTAVLLASGTTAATASALAQEEDWREDWRQEVRYTIEAELDEEAEVLRGAALFEYGNASPDTLDRLYLHLHLNAFRPGSLWARNERREEYDFGSLEEPRFAFERLESVTRGERELEVAYPHAPDSTVARVELSEPLPPGAELRLRLRWDARPATLCRRQCREGRHWDFAQWYPRIAVYEEEGWAESPLYPQGEFYGEFGTYDVTLDLREDQRVGATGIPVEGDPGWRIAEGSPAGEVPYRRDFYGDTASVPGPDFLSERTRSGRKRVRFRAENVHHFAWSVDPDFVYEGDRHDDVAIHVLYRPSERDEWGDGAAVERTVRALAWLEDLFGPYPYPQLTNLRRLEPGGTEFPMLFMDGSAGQGLITHEATHMYAHAILANNEWRQAWLDEGLTSFLSDWFAEDHGARNPWAASMEDARSRERAGPELPVDTLSRAFSDYSSYVYYSYTKAALVFRMLREYVGRETMREILRTYFDRFRFRHVSGEEFQRVAEDVAGEDLAWFFDQWFRSTKTLDYSLGEVTTEELADGRWQTRVEVRRSGEAWMPVTLRVGEVERELESRDRRQRVEVITGDRPEAVELDPERILLETDRSENRREL